MIAGLPGPDEPGRLHPLSLVAGPLRILASWALPLVVALVLGTRSDGGFSGIGFIALAVAFAVGRQAVEYRRLRWWVADGSIELQTGLLQVERRSLPLDRIQNVDVVEPLVARIVGLAEVRVESAASADTDITLRYVTVADARSVRDRLLRDEIREATGTADGAGPEVLVATPTSELLIAGATSNRIGALAAAIAAVFGVLFQAGIDPEEVLRGAADLFPFAATLVVVFVVAAIVVGWFVSIAQSVLRYNGFILTLGEREVRRSHGLLTRSSGRIPLDRVQSVRVERPILRRWLGRATIVADTAGSAATGTESGTGVVAPIVVDTRVTELVSIVLQRPGTHAEDLEPVSRLAIRRAFVRVLVPTVLITLPLVWLVSPWWLAVTIVACGLGWLWARRRWAAIGHRVGDDLAVVRSGVFTERTWFIPTAKVQSVAIERTPFQRRLGLASLRIDSAAPADGVVTVVDLTDGAADALAERLAARSAATAFAADGV